MKKCAFIFIVLFIITGCISVSPEKKTSPALPQAVIPELFREFEPVQEGTRFQVDFPVKNVGNGVLRLWKVNAG